MKEDNAVFIMSLFLVCWCSH